MFFCVKFYFFNFPFCQIVFSFRWLWTIWNIFHDVYTSRTCAWKVHSLILGLGENQKTKSRGMDTGTNIRKYTAETRNADGKGLDFGILCCHRTGSSRLFSRTQVTMDKEIFAISLVLISYVFQFFAWNWRFCYWATRVDRTIFIFATCGGESQPCRKTCRFKWFTRDIKRRNNAHDRKSHGHHIF